MALGIAIAQNLIGNGAALGTNSSSSSTPTVMTTGAGGVSATVSSTHINSTGLVKAYALGQETVQAVTAAASVALSGGTVGISAAGAGVYNNNDDDVAITASITGGSIAASGGVDVWATDHSSITATAAAVSVALAFGSVGAGIAVGIALAWNTIADTVTASISGATSISGGALDVEALKEASIHATSASAAFSAGFGAIGVAVSAAGAFAENVITSNTVASIGTSVLGQPGTTIASVKVSSTDQSIIHAEVLAVSAAVAAGAVGLGVALGGSVALNSISGVSTGIEASIQGTSVDSVGALLVESQSTQQVNATVDAGAVALAAGIGGAAGSAAGVAATNTISQLIEAFISGDGGAAGISAGSVTVSAEDNSNINAEAGAAAIAAAIGGFAGAISVAVSVASNAITNTVESYITGASHGVTATGSGSVAVTAQESAGISAAGQSAAAAVSGGGIAFSVAGAGVDITNTILNTTESYIHDSNVTAGSEVDVTTIVSGTITANVQAISVALSFGVGAAGGALGVAIAENFIGFTQALVPVKHADLVSANIDDTSAHTIHAGTKIDVSASDNSTIEASVAALSAAVVVGLIGGAVAGAGGSAINMIAVNDTATVTGSTTVLNAGEVDVQATDSSTIGTFVGAGSLAASISLDGEAAAAAFSLAENVINNTVTASISDATVSTSGDVNVDATENATIFAFAVAAAFAGGIDFAMSAGGVSALDTINTQTEAFLNNSTVTAGGNVNVMATDTSSADAETAAASVAVSFISIALSGSDAETTVNNTVSAEIEGSHAVDATGTVHRYPPPPIPRPAPMPPASRRAPWRSANPMRS